MSKGRQKFSPSKGSQVESITLVAGPLGNPQDITLRALDCIREADLVFCEDTRKFLQICQLLGIAPEGKRILSLPGTREMDFDFSQFLSFKKWIFMSDAGSPVVNDPGLGLIRWAKDEKIPVKALPGPSAPLLLWQWSGGFGLPFFFAGFVPKSSQARELEKFFEPACENPGSFCFFDTKYQILNTLNFLASQDRYKERTLFLGREMTKTYEELHEGKAADLRAWVETRLCKDEGLGELTLLMQSQKLQEAHALDAVELAKIRKLSPKEAAKIISKLTGQSVRACYDLIIEA